MEGPLQEEVKGASWAGGRAAWRQPRGWRWGVLTETGHYHKNVVKCRVIDHLRSQLVSEVLWLSNPLEQRCIFRASRPKGKAALGTSSLCWPVGGFLQLVRAPLSISLPACGSAVQLCCFFYNNIRLPPGKKNKRRRERLRRAAAPLPSRAWEEPAVTSGHVSRIVALCESCSVRGFPHLLRAT